MKAHILSLLTFILILSACKEQQKDQSPIFDDGTSQYWKADQAPFYHGVASGDPLTDAVIIWTRVTPEFESEVDGSWSIAKDAAMDEVVQSGEFTTSKERDYTVKIDINGLEADSYYYYQFEAFGKKSPVGRTKTAPKDGVEEVKLAVVSCSNFEAGYFNA